MATSLQFHEFYAWQHHPLSNTSFVAFIPNYNWTRLFMCFCRAVLFGAGLFGAVSHVVSISLGVLRRDTEQDTKSSSYGADLLLSHCRKSEHSPVQWNASMAGQQSPEQLLTPHGGLDDPLNHRFHCASSAVKDALTQLLGCVCTDTQCFPLVAGMQNRSWQAATYLYVQKTHTWSKKESIINNSMRS